MFGLKINFTTPLSGSAVETDKPTFTVKNLLSGSYQEEYSKWFAEQFPLRSYMLKLYNQIEYSLFQTVGNKNIIKGKNGELLEYTYVSQYLKLGELGNKQEYIDYVRDLKVIQEKLEAEGKIFFYIITPSKAEIYPEIIPNRYHKVNVVEDKLTNHELLVDLLKAYHIKFYDTTESMRKLKSEGQKIFPKTGIHWNYYGAANAAGDIFKSMMEQTDIILPKINIVTMLQQEPTGVDQDLLQLSNLYCAEKDESYINPLITYEYPKSYKRLNAVLFGTSFNHQLAYVFESDKKVFNEYTYFRYLQFRAKCINGSEVDKPLDKQIRMNGIGESIDLQDIVFIESNATDLSDAHFELVSYIKDYLNDKIQEPNRILTSEDRDIRLDIKQQEIVGVENEVKEISIEIQNNTKCILDDSTFNPICIEAQILDSNLEVVAQIPWQTIKERIMPGELSTISFTFQMPDEAGDYIISFCIVQDGITRVLNKDGQPLQTISLKVNKEKK